MLNAVVIGVYIPFFMLTAAILGIELFRHYKRQEDYLFALLCFFAFGWYIVNIWGLLADNDQTAKFCINFMLVFVGLIPPTLLLFIIKFYKINIKIRKSVIVLMYIIPAIDIIMAFTAQHHTLLNRRLEILALSPYREIDILWGPWFWVHTAGSYVISVIIIGLILFRHFRVTRFYRLPSSLMVAGVFMTLVGNIFTLLQIVPPVIEPTLITMSLSLIFFNLAVINNNNSKFVRFSRAHIYHYLAEYILVLNEKNQVIDHNRAATTWFSDLEISLDDADLDTVMERLLEKGQLLHNSDKNETADGIDIRIQDGMFNMILNRRIYQMKDARNESIGKIVVFSDVTENRTLIERLEMKAGMDSLTGLANHRSYVGARNRLNVPEYLPLSVIMCDANGLKDVNDTLGHDYGDILLQTVAGVLEKNCPKCCFVARIGGDEFIYLLPKTPPDSCNRLMAQIKKQLAAKEDLPFSTSVALGTATKYRMEEDIEKIIALADKNMYEDKKKMKQLS